MTIPLCGIEIWNKWSGNYHPEGSIFQNGNPCLDIVLKYTDFTF